MKIPKSHPRYVSLKIRDKIVEGVKKNITSLHGLMAHGRGEAFDYLLREKTTSEATKAIEAAAALLALAKYPVISVNGNTAALVPRELVALSNARNAPLEINIFHASKKREHAIKKQLHIYGAKNILSPGKNTMIKFLESNRKYVNKRGIYKADVVFVPLEDGDRTEALVRNGKKVIVVDLNPLSRSAQKATITIVDNIIRSMPLLISELKKMKGLDNARLRRLISSFSNQENLASSIRLIQQNFTEKTKHL